MLEHKTVHIQKIPPNPHAFILFEFDYHVCSTNKCCHSSTQFLCFKCVFLNLFCKCILFTALSFSLTLPTNQICFLFLFNIQNLLSSKRLFKTGVRAYVFGSINFVPPTKKLFPLYNNNSPSICSLAPNIQIKYLVYIGQLSVVCKYITYLLIMQMGII